MEAYVVIGRIHVPGVPEAAVLSADLLVEGSAVGTGACFAVGLVAEMLHLDEEVMRTEDVAEAEENGAGEVVAAGVDKGAHLTVSAGGEADESVAVPAEGSEIDGGREAALRVGQVGGGDEAAEVGVALPSLGQEYEVVGGGWEGHRLRLGGGRGAGGGSVYRRADRGAVTLGVGAIYGDAWAE